MGSVAGYCIFPLLSRPTSPFWLSLGPFSFTSVVALATLFSSRGIHSLSVLIIHPLPHVPYSPTFPPACVLFPRHALLFLPSLFYFWLYCSSPPVTAFSLCLFFLRGLTPLFVTFSAHGRPAFLSHAPSSLLRQGLAAHGFLWPSSAPPSFLLSLGAPLCANLLICRLGFSARRWLICIRSSPSACPLLLPPFGFCLPCCSPYGLLGPLSIL